MGGGRDINMDDLMAGMNTGISSAGHNRAHRVASHACQGIFNLELNRALIWLLSPACKMCAVIREINL
jgi:hypothetical protein